MNFKTPAIILAFCAVFILNSCSDILDVAPQGKLSIEDVFSDSEKTAAYLNTCYQNIQIKGAHWYLWSRGPVDWSDDAWDSEALITNNGISTRLYQGDASAGSHPINLSQGDGVHGDYWQRYWSSIRDCSVFIDNIDKADGVKEADRQRWKAEAHVLRAYYYLELLQWFGTGLPIERTPYDFTADFSEVEKPSYYETAKFVIEDCDIALNSDELPWRITETTEAMRVSKAVAASIKSRMILFAASPLYNDGENHWKESYELNKSLLNQLLANGYELYDKINYPASFLSKDTYIAEDVYVDGFKGVEQEKREYAALIYEYHANYPNDIYAFNPVDKETIWQDQRHQGPLYLIMGLPQGGAISGSAPTQEIVDAYETIDGVPILDLNQPYLDENHLKPNFNPNNKVYDEKDPYKNRDPRFYADIYFNGTYRKATWNFNEPTTAYENYPAGSGFRKRFIGTYEGEPHTGRNITQRDRTHTGYYLRKFLHPNSGTTNVIPGPNTKHFRLAEVYLNFAESAAENDKFDEARNAINTIRNRVGMPDLPSGLSKDDLILRIRNERRIELSFETNRFFDVRRWSPPSGDLSETDQWLTAAKITRNTDGTFTFERDNVVPNRPRECYTNRYLKMPIPLQEVSRMKSITGDDWQNPGW